MHKSFLVPNKAGRHQDPQECGEVGASAALLGAPELYGVEVKN